MLAPQLIGLAMMIFGGLMIAAFVFQGLDQWQRKAFPPKGKKG